MGGNYVIVAKHFWRSPLGIYWASLGSAMTYYDSCGTYLGSNGAYGKLIETHVRSVGPCWNLLQFLEASTYKFDLKFVWR